jgi:hypothetical protein
MALAVVRQWRLTKSWISARGIASHHGESVQAKLDVLASMFQGSVVGPSEVTDQYRQ